MKFLLPLFLSAPVFAGGGYLYSPYSGLLGPTISCANSSSVNVDANTLYIDCSNNRVGIGTASPAYPLDVNGTIVSSETTGGRYIRLDANLSGNGNPTIYLRDDNSATRWFFDNHGGTLRYIFTTADDGSAGSVVMRLDSSPRGIFIGENTAASDGVVIIKSTNSAATTGVLRVIDSSNNPLLRVQENGNIGIGTASPATKLHMSSGTLTIDGNTARSINALGTVGFGADAATITAGPLQATQPAIQTIAAADTITANACGTIKRLDAGGAVTTNTTNTITAPAAANAGCCMDIINVDTVDTITLDQNANNNLAGDVALGPCDTIRACSDATDWYFSAVYAGTCN